LLSQPAGRVIEEVNPGDIRIPTGIKQREGPAVTSKNSPVQLTDAERHFLQALAAEFDRVWDGKEFAAQVRKLPPGRSPFRRAALRELVRLDLLHHWRGWKSTSKRFRNWGPPTRSIRCWSGRRWRPAGRAAR
jgi:hypothetical protein